MKTLLFLLASCVGLCAAPIGFNQPTIPGCVGWWTLNEGSGTNAFDKSGFANHGTLVGSPTWTNGVVGVGLKLNGGGQIVSVSDNDSIDGFTNATISFWLIMPSSPAGVAGIISKRLGSGNAESYSVFFNTGVMQIDLPGFANRTVTTFTPTVGEWYHICLTFDSSKIATQRGVLHINGAFNTYCSGGSSIPNTPTSLIFGNLGGSSSYLNGVIDDVRIYNRALPIDEVKQLHGGGYGSQK